MFEVSTDVYSRRLSAYRDAGKVLGTDLAKALLLAMSRSSGVHNAKVELSAILLRELLSAVKALRELGAPNILIHDFERAARQACRDELVRGMPRPMQSRQAA